MKLKKVFLVTRSNVKEILFKDLKAGDVFYCENLDGSLDTAFGEFLILAIADAWPERDGNYGLEVFPILDPKYWV